MPFASPKIQVGRVVSSRILSWRGRYGDVIPVQQRPRQRRCVLLFVRRKRKCLLGSYDVVQREMQLHEKFMFVHTSSQVTSGRGFRSQADRTSSPHVPRAECSALCIHWCKACDKRELTVPAQLSSFTFNQLHTGTVRINKWYHACCMLTLVPPTQRHSCSPCLDMSENARDIAILTSPYHHRPAPIARPSPVDSSSPNLHDI